MELTAKDRRTIAALLMDPLPSEMRRKLLQDRTFVKRFRLRPRFSMPLGTHLVETGSLHDAQRKAISGKQSTTLKLNNNVRKRAKLSHRKGTAVITIDDHSFGFSDSDLFSKEKRQRTKAFQRVLAQKPLPREKDAQWHDLIELKALSDEEFVTLCTDFAATPESFSTQMTHTTNLDSDSLLPDNAEYFERLIAPLAGASNFDAFIDGSLTSTRAELLAKHRSTGLRRIAYSALWRPLIPFQLFRSLEVADVEPLLAAYDPFSLLCGFEICGDGLSRDPAFAVLGARFLEKLFDKKERSPRFSLFAAFATIATVNIRSVVRSPDAPLWWIRLAALAHAGVLTNAKAGMPNSEEFLKWASRLFGLNYLWMTTIDLHDAPRWQPNWIDPDFLFAEVVGRVVAAIGALSIKKLPRRWKRLLDGVIADLTSSGMLLVTQFAGPFDDFRASAVPISSMLQGLSDVEAELEAATQLDAVPGLLALIGASRPSEKVVASVRRILTGSADDPLTSGEELKYLRVAARVGASAHDTVIGDAILKRCIVRARHRHRSEQITDILQVMIEAVSAYPDESQYRKQVGNAAAAICLSAEKKLDLRNILTICDALCIRDERLIPALAKASAIARIKLG